MHTPDHCSQWHVSKDTMVRFLQHTNCGTRVALQLSPDNVCGMRRCLLWMSRPLLLDIYVGSPILWKTDNSFHHQLMRKHQLDRLFPSFNGQPSSCYVMAREHKTTQKSLSFYGKEVGEHWHLNLCAAKQVLKWEVSYPAITPYTLGHHLGYTTFGMSFFFCQKFAQLCIPRTNFWQVL